MHEEIYTNTKYKHWVLPRVNQLAWGIVPKCCLKGEVHIVPWGYSLACNALCVNPSIKWDIYVMCLFLQVFDFLGEVFHCSQDLFERASGRFIFQALIFFLTIIPLGLQRLLPMKRGTCPSWVTKAKVPRRGNFDGNVMSGK